MPTSLTPHTQDIIILGASGNCLDILDCVLDNAALQCLGFLDDNKGLWQHTVQGLPVLGGLHTAEQYPYAAFVNGIGNARNYRQKEAIIRSTSLPDTAFMAVVSPAAHIAHSACVGKGTVILAHSCVAAQAVLGAHVMVLQHCVINHDSIIEDFATLAAGVNIAGACHIARGAYIGSSACIREGVRVGEYAMVGMGAVVTNNVPAYATVVGNPAKILVK